MAGKPPPAGAQRKYEDEKLAATYLVGKSGADVREDELARKRGRKTIMIAAGALLALAIVGTAVGVGVTVGTRNHKSDKPKLVIGTPTNSSASMASAADWKYLPDPGTPEAEALMKNGSPEVKLIYQMEQDAQTITPEKVVQFLRYIDSIAHLKDKGVDMEYFEDQAGAIVHWFRAGRYTALLDILRKYANGEKVDLASIAQAGEQLFALLKDKGAFRSWLNWPGGQDDGPLSQESMTRRTAEDKKMQIATTNTLTSGRQPAVGSSDNKRQKGLLINPYQQYTNIIDPKGWMNNPSIMGYPSFKPIVIPIVFHLLMFNDNQGYLGPRNAYSRGNKPGKYLIDLMNKAYRSTNIQFRLSEWRNNPKNPKTRYLNLGSVANWQACASAAEKCSCPLAIKYNKDPRKYINIWISGSDAYDGLGDSTDIAYSTIIPSVMDTCKDTLGWRWPASKSRHLWFLWDQVDPDYSNSARMYNDGAATIIHEVGHQLGLLHTHQGDCSNLDGIDDTPANMVVQDASYYDTLTRLCIAAWRNPKKPIAFDQVKNMNTCRNDKYIDNLMNYMSYTHAACYKLFTEEQTKRMQRVVTSYYNRFRPKPAHKPRKKTGRRMAA